MMAGKGVYFCCYCRRSFEFREELISHVLSHYKDDSIEEYLGDSCVNNGLAQTNGDPPGVVDSGPTQFVQTVAPNIVRTANPLGSTVVETRSNSSVTTGIPPRLLRPPRPIPSIRCPPAGATIHLSQAHLPQVKTEPPPVVQLPPSASSRSSTNSSGSSASPHQGQIKETVTAADQKYQCTTCGKYFKYSHHFKAHKRIHEGEGYFSCDHCGKIFSQTAHLIRHKRIHTGERPFSCDVCPKTFNQSSHLIRHKRVHTGERPFICDHCHKSFSQSAHLMKHRRVHSGERPYPCDDCQKTFTQQVNLLKHRRSHHSATAANDVVILAGTEDDVDSDMRHALRHVQHTGNLEQHVGREVLINSLTGGGNGQLCVVDNEDDTDDYGSPICEDFKASCSPPLALSVGVGTRV